MSVIEPFADIPAPLVSVVMPSYNKGRYIAAGIASLQAQTHTRWELLVVDDASTDDSVAVVRALAAADPRIRLLPQPNNQGANRCRNIGIREARGEYLLFLDADDLLAPHCLAQRVHAMRKEQVHFAVFNMEVFRERIGDLHEFWDPVRKHPLEDFLMHRLPWSIMQPLWRVAFLREIGGFDEAYRRHQDVDLHTRALLVPGVRYSLHGGAPDCFYRVAEERKTLDAYGLLEGWTDAVQRYHGKYLPAAQERGHGKLLLGLVLRNYQQVLYHRRTGRITEAQFAELERRALDPAMLDGIPAWKRRLFRLARRYNLQGRRLPGLNRAIETLVMH